MRDLSRIREDGHYWLTRAQLMALGVTTLSLAALAFFVGLMAGQRQAVADASVVAAAPSLVDPSVQQDGLTELLVRVEKASAEAQASSLSFPEQLRDPEPPPAAVPTPPEPAEALTEPAVDEALEDEALADAEDPADPAEPGDAEAELPPEDPEAALAALTEELADVIVEPDARDEPEPPPAPPEALAEPAAATPTSGYAIQVAAYASPQEADSRIAALQEAGHSAYRVEALIQGNTWYRVRVGPYASQSAAAVARGELARALGQNDLMITEVR